jgi:hypothetical protein
MFVGGLKMTQIWLIITTLTIAAIYMGHRLEQVGYKQLGTLIIIIGLFQLLGEIVALL